MNAKPRWPPFPFFWYRTMADVLKDEAADAAHTRKAAEWALENQSPVKPTEPGKDPFAGR